MLAFLSPSIPFSVLCTVTITMQNLLERQGSFQKVIFILDFWLPIILKRDGNPVPTT